MEDFVGISRWIQRKRDLGRTCKIAMFEKIAENR